MSRRTSSHKRTILSPYRVPPSEHQALLMKAHSAGVDRATDGDRRYFEANPRRTYRVRLLSQAERAQFEILDGPMKGPTDAPIAFTAIKNLGPGVRVRIVVFGPIGAVGEELTDEEVGLIWESYADNHPWVRERETSMLRAMRLPGGPLHSMGREAR